MALNVVKYSLPNLLSMSGSFKATHNAQYTGTPSMYTYRNMSDTGMQFIPRADSTLANRRSGTWYISSFEAFMDVSATPGGQASMRVHVVLRRYRQGSCQVSAIITIDSAGDMSIVYHNATTLRPALNKIANVKDVLRRTCDILGRASTPDQVGDIPGSAGA